MNNQDYIISTVGLFQGYYWIKVKGLGWIVAEFLPAVEEFNGTFFTHKVDVLQISVESIVRIIPYQIQNGSEQKPSNEVKSILLFSEYRVQQALFIQRKKSECSYLKLCSRRFALSCYIEYLKICGANNTITCTLETANNYILDQSMRDYDSDAYENINNFIDDKVKPYIKNDSKGHTTGDR